MYLIFIKIFIYTNSLKLLHSILQNVLHLTRILTALNIKEQKQKTMKNKNKQKKQENLIVYKPINSIITLKYCTY